MEKQVSDFVKNGGTYRKVGDYYIPNITISSAEAEITLGVWGMRYKQYLKNSKRLNYNMLILKGTLIVIYQSENCDTKIDVRFDDETVWLTQAQLCELYQSSKANISEHIKNIFVEGELEEISVVRKFRTTASDGKSYSVNHYNLDMIISLGYRIKSSIATQFRL